MILSNKYIREKLVHASYGDERVCHKSVTHPFLCVSVYSS